MQETERPIRVQLLSNKLNSGIPASTLVFFLLALWLSGGIVHAQTASITGVVLNDLGEPIRGVSVRSANQGTVTDSTGFYLLEVVADVENTVIFSHVRYQKLAIEKLILQTGETYVLNPVLSLGVIEIDAVEVTATGQKALTLASTIPLESLENIPGANPGVETLLKLLPGVSSDNELSTQFRVRGGNFDENLIYVNGIEVYRPFLVRSAQQEGLSFLNTQLISTVDFSAGGFQARYGDRLSSVLDVQYKKPLRFAIQAEASLLGVNAAVENSSRDRRLTNVTGIRYRDNRMFVNSLPDEAIVQPVFFDAQTFTDWKIDREWSLSFLGSLSSNRYVNEPINRLTTFGTLQEPRTVLIDYEGREENRYNTTLGALQLQFNPGPRLNLRNGITLFHTYEEEYSDILASYLIGELETDITGEGGNLENPLGVGQSYNRSRNQLDALIFNAFHRGLWDTGSGTLRWGLKYQIEDFRDIFNETEFLFDNGTVVRPGEGTNEDNEPIEAFEEAISPLFAVNARNDIRTNRLSAFAQWGQQWEWIEGTAYLNVGLRTQAWTVSSGGNNRSRQWLFSPRMQFSYKPKGTEDMVWKASIGNYQQPPFFRELRDNTGQINVDVKAQNSWNVSLGNDWSFKVKGRPFTLNTELYYKALSRVNAYTVNDVRIRYRADNLAEAFAAGIDLRLSGAFVPGTQSWASLGLLTTQENIEGRGYIARPTDQRIKFGLLFQDYVPEFPRLKLYINLVYQTGVPGGAPRNADPYDFQNRLRDYRRADLGISYIFDLAENEYSRFSSRAYVPNLQLGVELFNMFNNQNSITNTWVRDVDSFDQIAIPNFLTSRLLNVKMKVKL